MLLLRFFLRLYNLYFSKDKNLAKRVRQMTGFVPARLSIFKLAFSHKSNQVTKDYAQTNNERLEYLGDAVLGTIVAEYLFKKYPNGDEGFLTKMRSKIVKRKSLNYIGDQMGLDVLLTEYNRTRLSSSMLGNAVEALVGAVYLEKGYGATKRFVIQRMLKLYVDMHELETVDDNYKSQLLEYCQKNGMQVSYKLLNKFKQDRRDRFKVAVVINGEQLSLADDFNKKSAEQLASLRALQKLGLIDKTAPQETGRKSPSKETSKVDRRPKRAKQERKTKAATTSSVSSKRSSSDEPLAVAANAKQQGDKTPRPKPVKSPPQRAKAKPALRKAPIQKKQSGAALPARKQRRNNSRLGRAIWNGTQTSGASIDVVDSLGYTGVKGVAKNAKQTPTRKKASAKTEHTKQTVGKTTFIKSTSSKKVRPNDGLKSTSTRKRRPVPLRLLTPIVKDASAVMAIDLELLWGDKTVKKLPASRKTRPNTTKTKRKPTLRKQVSSEQIEQSAKKEWADTPLGLTKSTESVQKPKAPRKKKKPAISKTQEVVTDKLDKWEDTLLEVPNDSGELLATDPPKTYEKSKANASTRHKRPQRRNTNRKKKAEE